MEATKTYNKKKPAKFSKVKNPKNNFSEFVSDPKAYDCNCKKCDECQQSEIDAELKKLGYNY